MLTTYRPTDLVKVEADWRTRRGVAQRLLAAARAAGVAHTAVKSVPGGFKVPAAVVLHLGQPDAPKPAPKPVVEPVEKAAAPAPSPVPAAAAPATVPATPGAVEPDAAAQDPAAAEPAHAEPDAEPDTEPQLTDKQATVLASLRDHPDLPLAEHARRTGASPKTVRDVRNRFLTNDGAEEES